MRLRTRKAPIQTAERALLGLTVSVTRMRGNWFKWRDISPDCPSKLTLLVPERLWLQELLSSLRLVDQLLAVH